MAARRKKPGPPAKYGRRPTLTIRVPMPVYRELRATAAAAGKSISETIEQRLSAWSELEALRADARRMVAEAKAAVDVARIQAIRQAGFQIVREAGGGAVTVNVSTELLLTKSYGILRSGFVAPDAVDKSPLEIAIERAVAAGVARALGGKPT